MNQRQLLIALFALILPLLHACSSHGVRGHPPFVQVNGLSIIGQELKLDLGVRNVNSEALDIQHIEYSLKLDDVDLAVYKAASRASVSANGTENLRFDLVATAAGRALLVELENGSRQSLEYALEGMLIVPETGNMKFRRKGHIYPVPGRPGQFR